ncbi:Protein of unknown function [Thermobacillus xylanilyticus]|uniref:Uncharacterized protein n=1 Tax=Thermobacillus xylanilyticus TaxID=76633 RepID=A0ABN7RUV4_THEXY|nr:Protein of unknown function [Thermobacillus xylanilyticus]
MTGQAGWRGAADRAVRPRTASSGEETSNDSAGR